MSKTELTPTTRKGDLPAQLTVKQVKQLDNEEFYPSHFYAALFGLKRSNAALIDFEDGIIKPDETMFKGRFTPFKKRGPGCKVRLCIRGRELKRVFREGRQPHRFDLDLERVAS